MAETIGVKSTIFCRVKNDWEDGAMVVSRHPTTLELQEHPIKDHQDPFRFMYDGVTHIIYPGEVITLPMGVVKHLIGDWDVSDPILWNKEQMRVLGNRNFIPRLQVDIIETPEEVEARRRDVWQEAKYPKPSVGRTIGKAAPKTPTVMDEEEQATSFEDEDILEAEEKKKVGRPPKNKDVDNG